MVHCSGLTNIYESRKATVMALRVNGYKFVNFDSITPDDGVGLYILESLSFTIDTNSKINLNFVENMWIEIIITIILVLR